MNYNPAGANVLHRRDFNRLLLFATGAAAATRSALALGTADAPVSMVYSSAIVIDSLCAPFTDMSSPPSAEALAAVRGSGITAINYTISEPEFEGTVVGLATVQQLVDRYPEVFLFVRKHSDIARAKHEGKIGIMPGFQYPDFLEESAERINMFRKLGVRIMQLTYNRRGYFGDGCLEPENGGLTKPGIDAMKKMNEIGVAVDLSHSGYRTTADAIAQSAKPVLITHSGCSAVYAHPRNKPDDILKALADRGGYFGVYLMPYLVASPTVPTREHAINHLVHAINVCGADHVGVGSDGAIEKTVLTAEQKENFDKDIALRKQKGIGAPGEDRYPYVADLNGPDHMLAIADELAKRGQPTAVIERVLGANFQRVIGEIWGAD